MYLSKVDKYKNHDHFYMPTGDGTEPDFVENEKHDLELVGKINVYKRIQADKANGDINVLIQRFKNGEIDVFNQVEGAYIDTTVFPESLAELHERVEVADDLFSQLDPNIKSLFKSADEFYSTYGTPEFFARISSGSGVSAPVASEVNDNEPGNNE